MTENTDTATLVREGKVNTLKLNNYNGKGIKLECYGTGQTDMQFIIELSGNNVITDDNIGIDFTAGNGNGKITFKGDGTLKINAPKPISYEEYQNTMIIKPASNVYTDKEEVTQKEVVEENQDDTTTIGSDTKLISNNDNTQLISPNNENDNNNLIMYIIFGVYGVLSLVIIIVLAIKLSKKKKEEII